MGFKCWKKVVFLLPQEQVRGLTRDLGSVVTAITSATATSTLPNGVVSTVFVTNDVSPTASSILFSTPEASSDGLSQGAKIGIGVAIPLAVILSLLLGFLIFRRRRHSRADRNGAPGGSGAPSGRWWSVRSRPELDGTARVEKDGTGVVGREVDGENWRREMEVPMQRHELHDNKAAERTKPPAELD